MNEFALKVQAMVDRAKGRTNQVIRKVALDMTTRIVQRTPVDTGRARANWMVGVGAPVETETRGTDPDGDQAVGRAGAALADYDFASGDSIFITNSVPYIVPLENGHSKQAPAGMVKVTVAEFRPIVESIGKMNV